MYSIRASCHNLYLHHISYLLQSTTKQIAEPKTVAQPSPLPAVRKDIQSDLKKQSTSPSSKYGTPANSVPSSPFVARRLKVNQSPAPSAASEVLI